MAGMTAPKTTEPALPFCELLRVLARAEDRGKDWRPPAPMEWQVRRRREQRPRSPMERAWKDRVQAAARAANIDCPATLLEDEANQSLARHLDPKQMGWDYTIQWTRPRSRKAWLFRQALWPASRVAGVAALVGLGVMIAEGWHRLTDWVATPVSDPSFWAQWGPLGALVGFGLVGLVSCFSLASYLFWSCVCEKPEWFEANELSSISEENIAYWREQPESGRYIDQVLASDVPFLRGDGWRLRMILHRRQQSEYVVELRRDHHHMGRD